MPHCSRTNIIEANSQSSPGFKPPSLPTSLPPSPLQVVALAMPNTLAFPLGFLGAAWGGAATAPLNPDYKEEEFRFYLEVGREGGREGGRARQGGGTREGKANRYSRSEHMTWTVSGQRSGSIFDSFFVQ